ncbi:AGE family epimerase/isomerase [Solibacillus sp. FSL K6-4121]|uniref:AGE family epimerase/isomerase n=1 Tax=Solibacillus sp. FSL K6-4121 TaxID=2921505 RepID=UPI0030F79114
MVKKEVGFYRKLIEDDFWPYWEQFVDEQYGGVFTCISNDGKTVLSEDKYTWSQGRFLWLCASLFDCSKQHLVNLNNSKLEKIAHQTADFLMEHAVMEDYSIAFLLSKEGNVYEQSKNDSIFADCFFVLGLSNYAKVFQNLKAYQVAKKVYRSIEIRINENRFNTAPYPIPAGFESQSISMILLNVAEELAECANEFEGNAIYIDKAKEYSDNLLGKFVRENGQVIEFLSNDINQQNCLLGRHINPGHTIEAIWFHVHLYEALGEVTPTLINRLEKMFTFNFDIGWDKVYGGLLRFVYSEAKEVQYPMEQLILDTATTKLWWPHSESLYTSLLLYDLTQNNIYYTYYEKVKAYTFEHFPNSEVGEWYQILDQTGNPMNKIVALPVKDPFHILRNFICIIKRWG